MPLQFRLPKDIPLDEYPKPEAYLEEARRLTDDAQKQGIILRVMGPIALHYYFPDYVDLYRRMERLGDRVFTDIDYAAYGKHRSKIVPFFEKNGYELEKRSAMLSGGTRMIFFSDKIPMIDVFFDKLDYNHPIDYRGRLEFHPRCVSLADLMLQKLQIVQINDKDLKDAMLLFLAAPVSDTDKNAINVKYVAKLFADDWGFYHTATTNLRRIKEAMSGVRALSDDQCAVIAEKVDYFLEFIEDTPKSGKWKSRAKTGTSKPWYQEVSDW
ncbi:MAG: hypothetical protein FD146_1998 [Anaerolineaceae bacterium]|nr:MAG: hypothetical protein FD146_1998 [Anaerolineaceae bacterium]